MTSEPLIDANKEDIMADSLFCENSCPICTNARKGNKAARAAQRLEMKITGGGCPFGRARQKRFGVAPDEPLPEDVKAKL